MKYGSGLRGREALDMTSGSSVLRRVGDASLDVARDVVLEFALEENRELLVDGALEPPLSSP